MAALDGVKGQDVDGIDVWSTAVPAVARSATGGARHSMARYSLKFLKTGQSLPLAVGKRILVGRSRECTLRLRGTFASRRHCEIDVTKQGVLVRDLGSRCGTLVNQVPIKGSFQLKNGDELSIGPAIFILVVKSGESRRVSDPEDTVRETAVEKVDENDAYFLSLLRELKSLRDDGAATEFEGNSLSPPAETATLQEVDDDKPAPSDLNQAGASDAESVKPTEDSPSSAESAREAIERHFRRRL